MVANGMFFRVVFDGVGIYVLRGKRTVAAVSVANLTGFTLKPGKRALINASLELRHAGGVIAEVPYARSRAREFEELRDAVLHAKANVPQPLAPGVDSRQAPIPAVPAAPLVPMPAIPANPATDKWINRALMVSTWLGVIQLVLLLVPVLVMVVICVVAVVAISR